LPNVNASSKSSAPPVAPPRRRPFPGSASRRRSYSQSTAPLGPGRRPLEPPQTALRVKKTQVSGDREGFTDALAELEESLKVLADVAVAHVASTRKRPSDAMRRRVRDLLRNAVADDEAREALARGVLKAEDGDDWLRAIRRDGSTTRPAKARCSVDAPHEAARRETA
jgi:hypothetical protein